MIHKKSIFLTGIATLIAILILAGMLSLLNSQPGLAHGLITDAQIASELPEISNITGVYFDEATNEVIVLGTSDPNYPTISRQYIYENLIVALRARYYGGYPGMTIEFGPQPGPDLLPVFYFGNITSTQMGLVMFEADRLLKTYSLGEDNLNPGTPYPSGVAGYLSIPDRLVALEDTHSGTVAPQRFFFSPEINFRLQPDEMGGVFSNTQAILDWAYIPADTTYTSTNATRSAQDFVDHFNTNYTAFAQEQWQRDNTALKELVQLFKINGIAKWLYDKNLDLKLPGADSHWLSAYHLSYTETPTYTPGITVTRSFAEGSIIYTIQIYGGVDGSTPNTYIPNDTAAQNLINLAKANRGSTDDWAFDSPIDYSPTAGEEEAKNSPEASVQIRAMAIKLAENGLENGNFESGPPWDEWEQYSKAGYDLIGNWAPLDGNYGAYLGGYHNGVDWIYYPDIEIPNLGPNGQVQFRYYWATYPTNISVIPHQYTERPTAIPTFDKDQIMLANPSAEENNQNLNSSDFCLVSIYDQDDNLLETIQTISEADPSGTWYYASHDLTAYKGQSVALEFSCTTNAQNPALSLFVDNAEILYRDVDAPTITEMYLAPVVPIPSDTITIEIVFSETMYNGTAPRVQIGQTEPYNAYIFAPVTGNGLTNGFSNIDPTHWFGTYTIPADAQPGRYILQVTEAEDAGRNAMLTDTSWYFDLYSARFNLYLPIVIR